jgi:hypothetical protein
LNEWDKQHADTIIPEMSMGTFATSSAEAWSKKTGMSVRDIDFSSRVAAWFDRGYRLKTARMIIEDE